MRQTKYFKTRKGLEWWIKKSGHLYQWQEIYISNGYGVECKRLRFISLP